MRVGIIGSGNIGGAVARLLVDAGHEVALANSRGPETLADVTGELGEGAHADTPAGAAAFGEIVLVAIPVRGYPGLPADRLAGKIVIDAGNYYPQRDGNIAELDDESTTSTEWLAAQLPGATVVKGFNSLYSQTLRDRGAPDAGDDRIAVFIAGDDQPAKHRVAALIDELGFAPVDTGTLAAGGARHAPGGALYGEVLTAREATQALA
jgi:8-hydroxy-5-deazaflavin:NADPH oxidoreductase